MDPVRSAERVKKLTIEPLGDSLVRFRSSLDDVSHGGGHDEVIHSLSIEGTISLPDLVIVTIEPRAHHHPYQECSRSLDPVRQLAGLRIGPGFRARVLEIMGGTRGCTHFLTMALGLAEAHTLSLFLRMAATGRYDSRNDPDSDWISTGLALEPRLENACVALRSESPVIRQAKEPRD